MVASRALVSIFLCFLVVSSHACSMHGIWRGTPVGGITLNTLAPTITTAPANNSTDSANETVVATVTGTASATTAASTATSTSTSTATTAQATQSGTTIVATFDAGGNNTVPPVAMSHVAFNRSVTDYLLQFDSPLSGEFSGASVLRKGQSLAYGDTFDYDSDRDCVVNFWGRFVVSAVNGTFSDVALSELRCSTCAPANAAARRALTRDGSGVNVLNGTDCLQIPGTNLRWIKWDTSDCESFTTNEDIVFAFNTTACTSRDRIKDFGPYGSDSLLSTSEESSAVTNTIAVFAVLFAALIGISF